VPLATVQAAPRAAAGRRVFVSYAREDADCAETFVKYFGGLWHVLGGAPEDVFYDRAALYPGQRWEDALGAALRASDLLVLLVSVHSVSAASYCMQFEVPAAVAAGIPIVPVVLSPCVWQEWPLADPPDGRTLGDYNALRRSTAPSCARSARGRTPTPRGTPWSRRSRTAITKLPPRAAAEPTRGDRAGPAGPGVDTSLVAYLCNQEPADRRFRRGLEEWDDRALVVLVKGRIEDAPDMFWERLRVDLLAAKVEGGPLRGPPLGGTAFLTLPRRPEGRRYKEEMEGDILDDLSRHLRGRRLAFDGPGALAAELRARGGVLPLLAYPPETPDDPDVAREGVEALLRLFERLPGDALARLVVAVNLERHATLFGANLVAAWRLRRFKRSLVVDLDPLTPVSDRDAREWYRDRRIGACSAWACGRRARVRRRARPAHVRVRRGGAAAPPPTLGTPMADAPHPSAGSRAGGPSPATRRPPAGPARSPTRAATRPTTPSPTR
jgi:hypothetical protein